MKREHWKSRLGFIWAAVGSAVGLGNIWRFPYIVGENGGALFVLLYILCLAVIGFPVLISEILIGRKAKSSPAGAFLKLGGDRKWGLVGKMTILTGFLVSSFYGVVAGWTLGYLVEAILGGLGGLNFHEVIASPSWSLGAYAGFMALCLIILRFGVQKGIEAGNKILMPLLMIVLVGLAIKGVTLPGSDAGLKFLFKPDWTAFSPKIVLMALGQAFFALSLGQGTMVTYGSYLPKKENITTTCFPITLFGTFVSLFAGIAIFSIVFSVGIAPSSGEGLMFQTLPVVFSTMKGGALFGILFFLLIFIAGLTSQISALEPLIAYLVDEKKFSRQAAARTAVICAFLVGVPSALSFGVLKGVTLYGKTVFDIVSSLSVNILVPLGGLGAALLVGWRWGIKDAFAHLEEGAEEFLSRRKMVERYLRIGIKYLAPIIIIMIMFS